jgi:hypothetical protein
MNIDPANAGHRNISLDGWAAAAPNHASVVRILAGHHTDGATVASERPAA